MTDGIILIDKPAGQTSFQALGALKRRLATPRVGHSGTLDRFATGLLVVLAGRMTRLCAFATAMDKEYVAEVRFGVETDTLDPEGTVTGEGPVPRRVDVEAALPAFVGTILQVPPQYSALHVDGRRAYQAARAGQAVDLAPRAVTVTGLDLVEWTPPSAVLRVACSKGTYVRALARDIAAAIGTRAHLAGLRRTRVGGFSVSEAVAPDAFDASRHLLAPARFFADCPGLATLVVPEGSVIDVLHGRPPGPGFFEAEPARDGIYGALSPAGTLVAVMERNHGRWRYSAVFPQGDGA